MFICNEEFIFRDFYNVGTMKKAKLKMAPLTLIEQQQPVFDSPLKPISQTSFSRFQYAKPQTTPTIISNRKRYLMKSTLILMIIAFSVYILITWQAKKMYQSPLNKFALPPLKQIIPDIQHFLKDIGVTTLLNVRCGFQCFISHKEQFLKENGITTFYTNHLKIVKPEQEGIYYDWINIHQYSVVDVQEIKMLSLGCKIGAAIYWNQNYYRSLSHNDLLDIHKQFKKQGLYYNTIQSLTLSRMQGHPIQIYTRVQKNSQQIQGTKNQYNFLAIQTTINLYRDIPYLRQWIGYHLTLGIDKIFIYDTFDGVKYGGGEGEGEGECEGIQVEAVYENFQQIWQDYYYSIVYVPWGKMKGGWLSLSPRHDYIHNFKSSIKHTLFLQPWEMIFSKFGLQLSTMLKNNQKQQDCYHIEKRLYLDRTCTNHHHMFENYQYLPLTTKIIQYVFKTEKYWPFWGSNDGAVLSKQCKIIGINQFSVHSYSLTRSKIAQIQKQYKYPILHFSYDFSTQSKLPLLRKFQDQNKMITIQDNCYIKKSQCPITMTKLSQKY